MMRQAPLDMTFSKKPWSYNFLELTMVMMWQPGLPANAEAGSHCLGMPVSEREHSTGQRSAYGGADIPGPLQGSDRISYTLPFARTPQVLSAQWKGLWGIPEHPPGGRLASANHLFKGNNIKAVVVINTFISLKMLNYSAESISP